MRLCEIMEWTGVGEGAMTYKTARATLEDTLLYEALPSTRESTNVLLSPLRATSPSAATCASLRR